MWRLSRAALFFAGVFVLMPPEGISLSGATAQAIPSAAPQSTNTTRKKTKPKKTRKILKGRHERHRRKPA